MTHAFSRLQYRRNGVGCGGWQHGISRRQLNLTAQARARNVRERVRVPGLDEADSAAVDQGRELARAHTQTVAGWRHAQDQVQTAADARDLAT